MNLEAALLTIVFLGIFLVLGLIYRVILGFKKDICGKFTKLEHFFLNHVHAADGTAYVPREQAAK